MGICSLVAFQQISYYISAKVLSRKFKENSLLIWSHEFVEKSLLPLANSTAGANSSVVTLCVDFQSGGFLVC